MATVRCYKCRGLKQVAAIGGIVKDCWVCDATGRLDAEEAIATPIIEPVVNTPIVDDAPPLIAALAEAISEECSADLESKLNDGASINLSDESDLVKVADAPSPALVLGVSDELLKAVLDEMNVEPIAWRAKYRHVVGLFGANGIDEVMTKVERANLRERYARLQPIAPRKVNLSAAQDSVIGGDTEYLRYKAQEDAKLKEAAKKSKSK